MKSKPVLIISGISLVALVLIVALVVMVKNLFTKPIPVTNTDSDVVEEFIPLDPSIIVNLTPRNDGKAVTLFVNSIPTGTSSLEYEIAYDNSEGLRKGANGNINLRGETQITRDDILFGTCSRNVCTYDTGVTSVSLTLRFNSDKGVSVFTRDYPITQ